MKYAKGGSCRMVWVLINVYRLENLSSPISTLLDDSRLCKIDYDMKETYEIYAICKGRVLLDGLGFDQCLKIGKPVISHLHQEVWCKPGWVKNS